MPASGWAAPELAAEFGCPSGVDREIAGREIGAGHASFDEKSARCNSCGLAPTLLGPARGGAASLDMRHIISILLQNEAGALARVANLFSSRGYNIESLNVAPTADETVSRLTLVTSGSDSVIEQISKQLGKLVDVVDIADMTSADHIERELALFKLHVTNGGGGQARGGARSNSKRAC